MTLEKHAAERLASQRPICANQLNEHALKIVSQKGPAPRQWKKDVEAKVENEISDTSTQVQELTLGE